MRLSPTGRSCLAALPRECSLQILRHDLLIVFRSNYVGLTGNQTSALLDSGTSAGFAPEAYIDFIYGSIPGALKQQTPDGSATYTIPCSAEPQLSFVFGGIEIPINPIDIAGAVPDGEGGIVCQAAFAAQSSDDVNDFILGDSFLRNAYVLFDFGTDVEAFNTPFIQILPVRR